jgi:hypothetical protein
MTAVCSFKRQISQLCFRSLLNSQEEPSLPTIHSMSAELRGCDLTVSPASILRIALRLGRPGGSVRQKVLTLTTPECATIRK